MADKTIHLMFVCLGNICRSPTAHGIFEHKVKERGLEQRIHVDSSGTGDWHIGHSPDARTVAAAKQRGFDLSHLRAEQINANTDFNQYDYILAMDKSNLTDLKAMCPANYQGYMDLFLACDPHASVDEVPDPYYGGEDGFETVLDLVEQGCEALLEKIIHEQNL